LTSSAIVAMPWFNLVTVSCMSIGGCPRTQV
jgi:hypothetical protein